MRRLLILLLFSLVLAGGAAITWQAMGHAKLVEDDLTTARALLGRAGAFESGELKRRLLLVDQAERHTLRAQQRLDRWPLRHLGTLPLVGRDVRVAKAVASSATGTARATRRVVTALQPVQTGPPTSSSIQKAAQALLALHATLRQDLERVRATRPLLTGASRTRYLQAAGAASATAERAGQGLKLAAGLYGPAGSARWFLAFQNPAELRGTGGLIGEYGILESSPAGPKLVKIDHYDGLNERTNEGVALPGQLAARYERFAIGRDWTAVNIPPDMPTVGAIIAELYERTTGDRIDGVVAADPLAVAEILRVTGPIQAGGGWLDADNVAEETLVRAYVRYQTDTNARRQFLREVATASFEAFRRGLTTEPVNLIRHLPAETYLDQDPATDSLADSPPRANSTIRAGHPCSLVILDRRGAIGGCGGRNQTDRRGVAGWSWTGPDRLLPALACSPVGAVTALAAAMLAPTGPAGRRATSPGLAGAVVVPTQCPRAGPSWAEGTPWLAGGTGRSSGAQQAAHLVVLVCSGQPLRDDPRRQASPLPLPGPTKVSVAATLVSIVVDTGCSCSPPPSRSWPSADAWRQFHPWSRHGGSPST